MLHDDGPHDSFNDYIELPRNHLHSVGGKMFVMLEKICSSDNSIKKLRQSLELSHPQNAKLTFTIFLFR